MSTSAQKYFLAFSILFGLIYVFLIPPFQAPDEDNHFFRCYQLANPHAGQEVFPDNRLGGILPSSLHEYASDFKYLRFNYEGRISLKELRENSDKNLEKVNSKFVDFSNTAMYFPSSYLGHIPVMYLASKAELGPASLLYLLRIVSLLTWIFFVWWALKFLEGSLFFYITLLPSILVLHSSVTADVISNSIAFFLFAFIFHLRKQKQKLNIKQLFLFAVLMLILSVNKIAYLPFLLLWFLLPYGKCSTVKKYYLTFLIIAGTCIILTALWANKVNENYITYENYDPIYRDGQQIKPNGNPEKQVTYILSKPIEFTVSTIKSYASVVPASLAHLTGKFGWEKNYLPSWLIGLLLLNLLLLTISCNVSLYLKERVWILMIVLATLYLLSIVMYGIYSEVGSDYVYNLGGKYLIPVFPLIFYLFGNKLMDVRWASRLSIPILLIAHLTMVYSILERYYF